MTSQPEGTEITVPAAPGPGNTSPSPGYFSGRWPLVILLLLAALPYIGVLGNDFAYVYDDKAQILDNPYVHSFSHLRETLTSSVWSSYAGYGVSNYYRPMTTLFLLLCYHLFGPIAYGFHLISLLLHAAIVMMVYLLAERLFRDRGTALGAAFLFALHPIHVEPVAWILDVADLELTLFFVLSFWLFLKVGDLSGRRQLWTQAAMLASFLLALASKEPALTLPFLAAIYEHFYRQDRFETTWQTKWLRQDPLWLALLFYIWLRIWCLGGVAHSTRMHDLTVRETLFSALALVGQYFAKLFWPAHLIAFYAFHPSTRFFDARVIAGVGALVLCGVVFVALWKRARPASFGILWLLATLAPVLNARWMAAYVFAERYLYLPSVGFCLVAGWAAAVLWRAMARQRPTWRLAAAITAFILAALCLARIGTRVRDWRDDVTLFTRSLADDPDDYRLHDALGQAYWIRGETAGAEREWGETLRLEPGSLQTLNSLGALYAQQNQFDKAIPDLERALQLSPNDANAHLILGAAYAETGKMDRAEENLRAAVLLSPMNYNAHNVLGKLYYDADRLVDAAHQFNQSIQIEPNLAAYDHLGYIYAKWNDPDRAEQAFKSALALNSADSHAHFNLGLIYAASGRQAQALAELQAALAADPHNPEILSALEKLRH